MFQGQIDLLPPESRGVVTALLTPLRWIPEWMSGMLTFFTSQSTGTVVLMTVALALPAGLLVAGMWSTMLSLYTIPFRSNRGAYMTSMLMAWWDGARMVWLYWTGFARLGVAMAGWVFGGIRFVLLTIRNALFGVVRSPLAALDWTSRRYFQPGVPWIAFLVLLVWSGVEATVFTYTLFPTLTEVFGGLTGYDPNPAVMAPLLWLFLFMLVAGSFACVHVLAEAIRTRKVSSIVQMTLVESAVMFFEVVFLYRELIDAITPWIAQQSGGTLRLGIASTMALASFGWLGVRGMSWFLFGRFGTPALLAILGRQTLTTETQLSSVPAPVSNDMWRAPVNALKADVAWFQQEGKRLFELLTLPVLQVLAAAINFAVVLVNSRPAFALPFKSLEDMLVTNPFDPASAAQSRASVDQRNAAQRPMKTPREPSRVAS
ncbi:MAG TPA: hypothetical protein VJR92_15315 [Gemmatimonadaceae bacterium]|nr:hypothetical protein [Gemmatimonadaceae bacterium]